jgi:hypothetical protein
VAAPVKSLLTEVIQRHRTGFPADRPVATGERPRATAKRGDCAPGVKCGRWPRMKCSQRRLWMLASRPVHAGVTSPPRCGSWRCGQAGRMDDRRRLPTLGGSLCETVVAQPPAGRGVLIIPNACLAGHGRWDSRLSLVLAPRTGLSALVRRVGLRSDGVGGRGCRSGAGGVGGFDFERVSPSWGEPGDGSDGLPAGRGGGKASAGGAGRRWGDAVDDG